MRTQTSLDIGGVPTTVVTWGKGLAEVNNTEEVQDIVLMIPGNPGYTPLYEEFLEEIYNRLGVAVWIVGHAGHELERSSQKFPPIFGKEALYDTNGQVVHKQTFIEKYIPANARLHLVGHSIGTYIAVQLLKVPAIQTRVIGSYLLFPTIERMAESPKGKSFVAAMKFQRLILLLIQLFTILPVFIQSSLVDLVCLVSGMSNRYGKICLDLLDSGMIRKIFLMANHEMVIVKERDTDTLQANRDKIKLYYGFDDGWTPKSYYVDLQREVPGIEIEIGSHKYKHAFLAQHSKEVGNLVASWIRERF